MKKKIYAILAIASLGLVGAKALGVNFNINRNNDYHEAKAASISGNLYIGAGVTLSSGQSYGSAGHSISWSSDPTNNKATIIMDNFTFEGEGYCLQSATGYTKYAGLYSSIQSDINGFIIEIIVKGTNKIKQTKTSNTSYNFGAQFSNKSGRTYTYVFKSDSGDPATDVLTFEATNGLYNSYGIVSNATSMHFDGPTVNFIGANTSNTEANNGKESRSAGIYSLYGLEINAGVVNAYGGTTPGNSNEFFSAGIYNRELSITVNGGTLNAESGHYTAGSEVKAAIYISTGSVTFDGGVSTLTGDSYGFYRPSSGFSSFNVTQNVDSVTAIGGTKAITTNIVNAVKGSGWNNTTGSGDPSVIEISSEAHQEDYKRVKFGGAVIASATGYNGAYDGNDHSINVSVTKPTSGYTIQYRENETDAWSNTKPTYNSVGNYTTYYKISADGFDDATGSETVAISKVAPTYTAPTIKSNLKYTGSAQALANAGTSSDGTFTYKLSTASIYDSAIPTGTEVGTYTVDWKLTGDANHDNAEGNIEVTIAKADLIDVSVEITSAPDKYDGSAHHPTLATSGTTVTGGAPTFTYSKTQTGEYSSEVPSFTDLGSHTIYWKASASSHNDASGSIQYQILKGDSTYTVTPTAKTTLVYTGEAQALINAGTSSCGTVVYHLIGGSEGFSEDVPGATNAGQYTVQAKILGNSNYNDSTPININVTIAKATPEYTVPTGLTVLKNKTLAEVTLPNGWTWDDSTQNVGSEAGNKVFKGTFTPEDTENYNLVEHMDITVLVIEHEHNWSYTANGNKITASCSTADCPVTEGLTIELEAPTNLTYDGNAKVATFKAGYSTEAFPSPTIKYYQGTTEVASCVNAGTYTAKVTVGGVTAQVEFTIAKATPTPAEVTDRNATYGQSLSEIALLDGWSWNSPTDKVGNVGTNQHKATFTPEDADNYNTVEQNVNVIVAKANPEYTVPTGLTGLINKTLASVALPTGWSWEAPDTNLGSEVGEKTFKATFTPTDTTNYNIVEHIDVKVNISAHEHAWSYTASGASITASCSAAECQVTSGLTLTLKAPTGDMHYDGKARVATIEEGYNTEAFPNPQIKYFSGDKEVTECVNVGKYIAKVTFGNAVAMVEFEILGNTIVDPDTSDVSIKIDDAVVPENVELRVEVRTNVAEKDVAEDYAKIQAKLESNEQISKVYDVKLIQTVGGVEKEIQPSDIQPGLKITVRVAIPEGMDMDNVRILHIHSVTDMEFVSDYVIDGNDLVFEIDRLSQFAFITKVNAPAAGLNGGIIALIIILSILALLGIAFLLLFFVFAKFIVVKEKEEEKVVRAIKIGKDNKDNKDYFWMMTFKFRRELKLEEEVFDRKQDAEDFLNKNKGQQEQPSEDK